MEISNNKKLTCRWQQCGQSEGEAEIRNSESLYYSEGR